MRRLFFTLLPFHSCNEKIFRATRPCAVEGCFHIAADLYRKIVHFELTGKVAGRKSCINSPLLDKIKRSARLANHGLRICQLPDGGTVGEAIVTGCFFFAAIKMQQGKKTKKRRAEMSSSSLFSISDKGKTASVAAGKNFAGKLRVFSSLKDLMLFRL